MNLLCNLAWSLFYQFIFEGLLCFVILNRHVLYSAVPANWWIGILKLLLFLKNDMIYKVVRSILLFTERKNSYPRKPSGQNEATYVHGFLLNYADRWNLIRAKLIRLPLTTKATCFFSFLITIGTKWCFTEQ